MTPRLIHLGHAVADLVVRVGRLPGSGQDVAGHSDGLRAGGGVTVMREAARGGLSVVYAGTHGTGPHGDLVRAALATAGVTTAWAPEPDLDTGVSVVLVDPSGERSAVSIAGAEARPSAARLDGLAVGEQDLLYVSGYAVAADPDLIGRLSTAPGRLFVDAGPRTAQLAPAALDALMRRAQWWSSNRAEAGELTGRRAARAAAAALAARTAATVIVRAGPAGCTVAEPGRAPYPVPAPAVDVVDSTGAGDTWAGAFLAAVARGAAVREAAATANGAAAEAVTRPGPGR